VTPGLHAIIALLSMLPLQAVVAAEVVDSVGRTADGRVIVTTTTHAPSLCHSAGAAYLGTPEGVTPITGAVSVTQPMLHSGGEMCAMIATEVKYRLEIDVQPVTQAIILYLWNQRNGHIEARVWAVPAQAPSVETK
jgi:hypothetical protein